MSWTYSRQAYEKAYRIANSERIKAARANMPSRTKEARHADYLKRKMREARLAKAKAQSNLQQ